MIVAITAASCQAFLLLGYDQGEPVQLQSPGLEKSKSSRC